MSERSARGFQCLSDKETVHGIIDGLRVFTQDAVPVAVPNLYGKIGAYPHCR